VHDPLADKPYLDIDVKSYTTRLKWLINKRDLTPEQHQRERQDLEAALTLLQSLGLMPKHNTETIVVTPSSALTASTRSSGRNYGMIAEGINNKEEFDVWKVQEARNELALETLQKWFSPYAQEIAAEAWKTCDPGIIFDFYFNMFAKDIPMIATIAQEQLRIFTFDRGQKMAEFLVVFKVLIDLIERLEQTRMSEFHKRISLERAFMRANYTNYRHVFHNAKMNKMSFADTIGYITEFEHEDMQLREAQALLKKNESDGKESKRSGRNSNQQKGQASVNLAAEQPRREHREGHSGRLGGRGGGRGRSDGRGGRSGRGRGNSADRRYQGQQQQESQTPNQNPPNPPRQPSGQPSGQQQEQSNRGQQNYPSQGQGQQAPTTGRDFHQAMQRQAQANPPQAPNPPRTHSTHFAADYKGLSSSEDETHLAMEVDSDADSASSCEMCGMAMEQEDSGSDSEADDEQERKRQRLGTPGKSQSDGEVTFEPVYEEEKSQIIQASHESTNFDLADMGENELAAIGGIRNRPSIPRFHHVPTPPSPPPQPIESPQPELSVQDGVRIPLFDHEPIDPVAGTLSTEEQRQFGMISRNLYQWQKNFLRKYGSMRLSPEESFITRRTVTNLDLQVMKLVLKNRLAHTNILEDIKEILTHYIMGIRNIPFSATDPNSFTFPDQLLVNARRIRVRGMTNHDMAAQLHSFRSLRMCLILANVPLEIATKLDNVAFRLCSSTLKLFFHHQIDRDPNYRPFRKDFTRTIPGHPSVRPLHDGEYAAIYETFSQVWNCRQEIIDISDSDDDDDNDEEKEDDDDNDNNADRDGSEWKEPEEDSDDEEKKDDSQEDEVIAEESSVSPSYSSEAEGPGSSHPFPDSGDAEDDDPFVGAAGDCDVSCGSGENVTGPRPDWYGEWREDLQRLETCSEPDPWEIVSPTSDHGMRNWNSRTDRKGGNAVFRLKTLGTSTSQAVIPNRGKEKKTNTLDIREGGIATPKK
jgi:hypothetical protein